LDGGWRGISFYLCAPPLLLGEGRAARELGIGARADVAAKRLFRSEQIL